MANNIDIIVNAIDNASKTLKTVQGNVTKMSWEVKKGTENFQDFFKKNEHGLKNIRNVSAVSFASLVAGSGLAVKAFQAQEEAETRLETIARKVTWATEEQIQGFKDLASELQKVWVVGDEAIIAGQSQLASFTKSAEAVSILTPALADLAVATYGVNVSQEQMIQTANTVGKGLQEQLGALTRTGILVGWDFKKAFEDAGIAMKENYEISDEVARAYMQANTETERAGILADIIADNYGWLNEAMRQTSKGGWKAMQDAFGDMMEQVGEGLIPIITSLTATLTPLIIKATEFISENKTLAAGLLIATTAVTGLIGVLITIGFMLPWLIATFKVVAVVIGALMWPIGLVILAVGALIAVGVTLYKNWDTFTANLEAIWQTFSANIKNWTKILVDSIKFYWTNLRMNLNAIMQAIVDMVKRMGENIVSFFKNLWPNMLEAGQNMMNMLIQGIKQKVEDLKNAVAGVAQKIKDFLGFSSPTKEWPWSNSDKWIPNLINMLVDGFDKWKNRIGIASERIAEKIKEAIGEEAFEEIGKGIEPFLRSVEGAFFAIEGQAMASKDKISSLKDEFLDLQKSLENVEMEMTKVGQGLEQGLAGRAVDLQKEIERLTERGDMDGIEKVRQELEYIKEQGITESMINDVLMERAKSESQRMVERAQAQMEELNTRKNQIQEEMDLKLEAMRIELVNYQKLTDEKNQIQKDFFALTGSYIKKQIADTDLAITRLRELRSLSWGGASLPPASNNNTSNTQNMSIEVNMGGMVVNNGDGNQVADQIISKITREIQLYQQGIA